MFNVDPARLLRITASMAPWLVSGDEDIIQRMFLRITSDPRYVDDDFSKSWLSHYGLCVEPVALNWYAETKQIEFTDKQKQYIHPQREWVSATLDARIMPGNIVCDVKCINGFASFEDRAAFYLPQMIVQQECAGADGCALLFVKGGEEPVLWRYDDINAGYRAKVWQRIELFWQAVNSLTPPFEFRFKRIVPPEQWRTIDLDDDQADQPNWADDMRAMLKVWDGTKDAAVAHDKIKTDIKQLLPDDVGTLLADKLQITRNRRNAVTVARRKEER